MRPQPPAPTIRFPSPRTCAHAFQHVKGWWHVRKRTGRWECYWCGFRSRHYDSIDAAMCRPVHPHMSVALRGFNCFSRRSLLIARMVVSR